MFRKHHARSRALTAALAGAVLLGVGAAGALQAQAATTEIAVGSLAIVNGTATGSITGLAPNAQVTVDGRVLQADQTGSVTLTASPLDGDGVLTLGYTDAQGAPQTLTVNLTDAVTGLPLTPAQLLDGLPNTTRDVRIAVTDGGSGAGTGGGSGTGTGGGTGSGSSSASGAGGSTPTGAVATSSGVSIPASSVVAGQARLVIASVKFNPTTVRSRTKPIRAEIVVKDTRGFLVRDAIVLIRGVPEGRLLAVAEARTSETGVVVFNLMPTKRLELKPGGRLNMFARARKAGEPINGGVSTRRLLSLRLARPS